MQIPPPQLFVSLITYFLLIKKQNETKIGKDQLIIFPLNISVILGNSVAILILLVTFGTLKFSGLLC